MVSHVIQQIHACEKVITGDLAARCKVVLRGQAKDNVGALAEANVVDLCLLAAVGLDPQQLSVWRPHAPLLEPVPGKNNSKNSEF